MNVIKAVFGGGRFAKTAPVFQWDTGDKLQFIGISLPNNYQVHFANSFTGDAGTVLGDESGVAIPPQYLQPGTECFAWVWLSNESGGFTKYQVTIPVYRRATVTGQTPTPAQQSALDEAIEALNDAAEDLSEAEQGIPTAIDTALQEAKDSGEFDGEPGFSPLVSVFEISGGHRVTITDLLGPHTYIVMDGVDGQDGQDGYSPTVTVEEISGGHRVTITDADGDHVFDVMDGTGSGSGAVESVNGQTGAVVLDATDVGALPSNTTYVSSVNGSTGAVTVTVPTKTSDLQNDSGFLTSAPVISVNNKTGAVSLTASDVGAGTYSKPSGGIPKTDLASAVQTSLGKADTALQSAPVTSVNGQTGAVTVTVPTKTSDLTNDSGFITSAPEEIFWATYGTTTSAEIETAYQAGKLVMVIYNSIVYQLTYRGAATSHVFGAAKVQTEATIYTLSCSSDVWSATTKNLIEKPASPTTGDFLVWNGSAWAATSLSTWQGGNY